MSKPATQPPTQYGLPPGASIHRQQPPRQMGDGIPAGYEPVEAYWNGRTVVVLGWPDSDDETHNCDALGCSSVSHVLARFPLTRASPSQAGTEGTPG